MSFFSPADQAAYIRRDVLDVIWQNAYPLVVETMLFTMHAILTGYFIWRRVMDRKVAPYALYMLFVALAMFFMLSAYWAIDMFNLLETARSTVEDISLELGLLSFDDPGLFASEDTLGRLDTVQQGLACGILLLGDYVVLWRAFIIWGRPRWLLVVTVILAVIFTAVYGTLIALGLQFFGRMANLIPNLIATLLVSYKAWTHWRNIRTFANQTNTRHSLAILLVILESGFVFAGLSASYLILFFFDGLASDWAVYVLTPLFAMYPMLVIVLVQTRRNLLERSIQAASTLTAVHQEIPRRLGMRDGADRGLAQCPTCQHIGGDIPLRNRVSRRLSIDFDPRMTWAEERVVPKNEGPQQHLLDTGRFSTSSSSSDPVRSADGAVDIEHV